MIRVLLYFAGAAPLSLTAQSNLPPAVSSPTPLVTPAPSTLPNPSRVQQLEATYLSNLRVLHAPVLKDYLSELEKLKQSLTRLNRPVADIAQVDAELARVKKLSILTYEPPKPPPPPPVADKPEPKRPALRPPPGAVVLAAKDASSVTPPASTPPGTGKTDVLALGSAAWKQAGVPIGDYEVRIIYACAKIEPGRTVTAEVNGMKMTRRLTVAQSTDSDENFRLLQVGSITIDRDTPDLSLTLQADPPGAPPLWIRSVMLAHPKPKPKPPAP